MAENEAVVRLRDVHKAFGGRVVLDGVNLDIRTGRTTVIIGPSGCGKSVLLKHIIGLLKPDRGRVFFHDLEVSAMPERRLAEVRRRMGFLFQAGALFDSMTVEQNIAFPLEEHGLASPDERRRRADEALSLVGLSGLQDMYPEKLSGGQRKRVALARAIVLGPEVILYDEPTTGLDPIRADLINELILKLGETLGTTTVVVTHDMTSARKIAHRVLMLHGGRFIADTTPGKLDSVDNEIVARFVQGVASDEELAELRAEALLGNHANGANTEAAL